MEIEDESGKGKGWQKSLKQNSPWESLNLPRITRKNLRFAPTRSVLVEFISTALVGHKNSILVVSRTHHDWSECQHNTNGNALNSILLMGKGKERSGFGDGKNEWKWWKSFCLILKHFRETQQRLEQEEIAKRCERLRASFSLLSQSRKKG